jgi:hypothetical protein
VNAGEDSDLKYQYAVTGGSIVGKGANVVWVFHDARPGQYEAEVRVKDGHGHSASSSTRVTFEICGTCDPPNSPSPEINLSCPAIVIEGQPALVSVHLVGPGSRGIFGKVEFKWSLSAGKIIRGAGTRTIRVDTRGLGGQRITAVVDIDGLDPSANRRASCTTVVVRE